MLSLEGKRQFISPGPAWKATTTHPCLSPSLPSTTMSQPAQGEKSVFMTRPWSLGLVRTRGHQSVWWVTWQTKDCLLPGLTMERPRQALSCPASPSARDTQSLHTHSTHPEGPQKGGRDKRGTEGQGLHSLVCHQLGPPVTSAQAPPLTDLQPFIRPSKPTQVPPCVASGAWV